LAFTGLAALAADLPYNFTTGAANSGDTRATIERPAINGVCGHGTSRGAGFGSPLGGITKQLPAREMQFLCKLKF
jgi:hypothetical protein